MIELKVLRRELADIALTVETLGPTWRRALVSAAITLADDHDPFSEMHISEREAMDLKRAYGDLFEYNPIIQDKREARTLAEFCAELNVQLFGGANVTALHFA